MDGQVRLGLELELPEGEHRERLLDALANLIRRRGVEHFVSAPILLPHSKYFPERWERNVVGAKRLLRRLMHYAGLGDLKVRLASWRERPPMPVGLNLQHTGNHAAAWFAGIDDDICEFGLELDQLRHEQSLVAALGHEVAHAFRDQHALVISDRELEEKLTDLTCVYLGFGVFTLNASHVVETGGIGASGEKLLFETRSLGYLSPSEQALLLAAQLAVRADPAEQRAIRKELLPNHAALVEQGLREFATELDALCQRLALPERTSWPARGELGELVPLPDDDDDSAEADPDGDDEPLPRARGASGVAFRVKRDRTAGGALLGLGATGIAGAVIEAGAVTFYGLCALGFAGGILAGRRIRADECSGCRARLTVRDEHCRGCGARVAGEIATHEDRLDAEERYLAERGDADADDGVEEEDPIAVLFTAMLAAWGLSRGLIAEDASEADRELERRVRERDFDKEALFAAWTQSPLLNDEAMQFANYYATRAREVRALDFGILATANTLDDRPANYRRFAEILDRRFAEWRKSAEGEGE